jgi:hypothetical protein
MKKTTLFVIASAMLFSITACYHHGYRTRTVKANDDNNELKIEYNGNIIFNEKETDIVSMEPDGYIKYRKNNNRITIQSNENGDLNIKVYKNGTRLNNADEESQDIINKALKDIAEHNDR